jgi:hypothetical protein
MRTVFLSSTSKDLSACREAAFLAIQGLEGYHCVRMEDFGSWNQAPDELCRERVAKCDLFICMAGPLYGSLAPAGKSFTEREYDAAVEHQKPCLIILTDEDFPLPANLIEPDEHRKRQAAFRETIAPGKVISRFATPEQAAVRVIQAIRNWEATQAAAVPTQQTLLASQIKSVSYRVAVLNRSELVSDKEAQAATAALQKQVRRDFAPAWGIDAELTYVPQGGAPEPGSWWLVIEDTGEYAGAVAYHTVTAEGLPQVKISVVNARQASWPWTMGASHDLMEMLANPRLNRTVFVESKNQTGTMYMQEICDPVASPELTYTIDGVTVADFVYPAWFESFRQPGSTQFDHLGHVSAPFTRAEGGYMHIFEVREGTGWRPVFGPVKSVEEKKAPAKKSKRGRAAKSGH